MRNEIIKVSDVPEGGMSLKIEFSRQLLDLNKEDVKLTEDGIFYLDIKKTGENIIISGRFHGKLAMPCSRCLKSFTTDLNIPIYGIFLPAWRASGDEEIELNQEDLDIYYYYGDEIDLSAMLREQIILLIPIAPLCAPDCQGIEGITDKYISDDDDYETIDPRLAKLKEFKKQ